jgi:hypothetical protein
MLKLKRIFLHLSVAIFCSAALCRPALSQPKPSNPRAAVRSFFNLLKTQKYDALYDFLPSQLQQQITREQLSQSIKRLESFIVIERMEIGRVQQRGDYSVVETTIYGRLKKTANINGEEVREGRIAAQQFLFRENGQWKLATADNRSQAYFLKSNPEFNRQFQLTRPRFEFKQGGEWKSIR